ncbi:hypothetical protein ACM66B_003915 [Microbotryomycetes sp. NB124-2]
MAGWANKLSLSGLKFNKITPAEAKQARDQAQEREGPLRHHLHHHQPAPAAAQTAQPELTHPAQERDNDSNMTMATSQVGQTSVNGHASTSLSPNNVPQAFIKTIDPRKHPSMIRRVVNIIGTPSPQPQPHPVSQATANEEPTETAQAHKLDQQPASAVDDLESAPDQPKDTPAPPTGSDAAVERTESNGRLFRDQSPSDDQDDGPVMSDTAFTHVSTSNKGKSRAFTPQNSAETITPAAGPSQSTSADKTTKRKRSSRPSLLPQPDTVNLPPLPHYTVLRATKNSPSTPHVIRIDRGVTDGDPSRWPTNTTEGTYVDGRLNWHDAIPLDQGTNDMWRRKVAAELASRLGLTQGKDGAKGEHWILEDWPEHYKFFIHRTRAHQGGAERTDPYLYGSKLTLKFRSVNETIPHIEWLLLHGPDDDRMCECKYCGKKTQAQVNEAIGLLGPMTRTKREGSTASSNANNKTPSKRLKIELGSANKTARSKARHGQRLRSESPAAMSTMTTKQGAQSRPRDPTLDLPSYVGSYTNKQRDFDLSDNARCRRGELVWARLPRKLRDDKTRHEISFWPGLVSQRDISITSKRVGDLKPGEPAQIENVQRHKYTVKLLGVDDTVTCLEGRDEISPWLARSPLAGLVLDPHWTTAPNAVSKVWDGKRTLMPKLNEFQGLSDAVTTYALALQVARALVQSFGLNDRYTITENHIRQTWFGPLTFQDDLYRTRQLSNFHYQSLWWGAELVWSGELVRLLLDDVSDLEGASLSTLASSTFPATTTATTTTTMIDDGANKEEGKKKDESDVSKSGYFLKVSAIYKDSDKDQGMLLGTLYELRHQSEAYSSTLINDGDKSENQVDVVPDEDYMPPAPPGYKFYKTLERVQQVQVDIDLLAGRYYPPPTSLDSHEFEEIVNRVKKKIKIENDNQGCSGGGDLKLTDQEKMVCLTGVLPATTVYMPCLYFHQGRQEMTIEAELQARDMMRSFLKRNNATQLVPQPETLAIDSNPVETPMDVSA